MIAMAQRITRERVEARIDTVNRLLGYSGTELPQTDGMVTLSGAYGGWEVQQFTGGHGGTRTLSQGGHGPLRDAHTFLGGMIAALREGISRDATAARENVEGLE